MKMYYIILKLLLLLNRVEKMPGAGTEPRNFDLQGQRFNDLAIQAEYQSVSSHSDILLGRGI